MREMPQFFDLEGLRSKAVLMDFARIAWLILGN
jgi:hypothetical protein